MDVFYIEDFLPFYYEITELNRFCFSKKFHYCTFLHFPSALKMYPRNIKNFRNTFAQSLDGTGLIIKSGVDAFE